MWSNIRLRAKSTADSSGDGPKKTSGRKYLTLKLVDFGRTGSDSQSSKAVIKGGAVLNLILFEADSYSTIRNFDGLSDRVYRGGSGGAFEACANFRQGTVIAILNSKILKPFQKGAAKPHPTDNVLALTPENASSIVIIGQSRDLGTCHALKRDGKHCGSWCDLRNEWDGIHVRPTAPWLNGTRHGEKVGPPPSRRLKSFRHKDFCILSGPEYVGEAMGREKHERKKRKREAEVQELELQKLLEKDGGNSEGAKTLAKAREAILGKLVKPGPKDRDNDVASSEDSRPRKRVFSATDIQRIRFDPTAKQGKRLRDDEKTVQVLNELQSSKPKVKLGPWPGPKIRSGVSIPAAPPSASSVKQPNAIGAGSSATTLSSRSLHVHDDDELEIV
ncbi:hypothetical protein BS47DRAFT_1369002 [Hydnum rufescens UP504]|uniref:Zinc finger Mcm10/DnaG-type domain-containing protein n=1 Tax=Hydnum rufescens UP504 TaxID=1448309 RepID=A0A9P6DN13_9AGAM|nr:hypothetical protein BS47DRAFT_1369002 [Hydnum rufescens UP504]